MGSRSILAVIDTVQSWLTDDDVDSAELSVGDRSYAMVGPRLVPASERAPAGIGGAA
jgi:hypothetical protein